MEPASQFRTSYHSMFDNNQPRLEERAAQLTLQFRNTVRNDRSPESLISSQNKNFATVLVQYTEKNTNILEEEFFQSSSKGNNENPVNHAERIAWEDAKKGMQQINKEVTIVKIIVLSELPPCKTYTDNCETYFSAGGGATEGEKNDFRFLPSRDRIGYVVEGGLNDLLKEVNDINKTYSPYLPSIEIPEKSKASIKREQQRLLHMQEERKTQERLQRKHETQEQNAEVELKEKKRTTSNRYTPLATTPESRGRGITRGRIKNQFNPRGDKPMHPVGSNEHTIQETKEKIITMNQKAAGEAEKLDIAERGGFKTRGKPKKTGAMGCGSAHVATEDQRVQSQEFNRQEFMNSCGGGSNLKKKNNNDNKSTYSRKL